jgi:Domain of unknown function (DUF6265)
MDMVPFGGKIMTHKLLVLLFLLVPSLFSTAAEPKVPKVADLQFLFGQWQGQVHGGIADEWWSPVTAGHVTGVMRLTREGKVPCVELLTILDSPDGPRLFLRRFNPDLKDEVEREEFTFSEFNSKTAESGGATRDAGVAAKVVFRNPGKNGVLAFAKTDAGLEISISYEANGKLDSDTYLYRKVR